MTRLKLEVKEIKTAVSEENYVPQTIKCLCPSESESELFTGDTSE